MTDNTKIAVFSGASAVGKSTQAKRLIELYPDRLRQLTTVTTRARNPRDLPGEYQYMSLEEFAAHLPGFLWNVPVHGHWYAVQRLRVGAALWMKDRITLANLTPDLALWLCHLYPGHVRAFYFLSPSDEELRRRHSLREGITSEEAERRITDGKRWDRKYIGDSRFTLIPSSTVEAVSEQLLSHLSIRQPV